MIPLLGVYLDKTTIQKDTCIPIFIAALFTVAKTRKQPKCPKWTKMMWYIYTMDYYSSTDNAICSNVNGPWSKPDKDKYHMVFITPKNSCLDLLACSVKSTFQICMWNLKKWYKWIYLQNRSRLIDLENKLMVTKGREGRGLN